MTGIAPARPRLSIAGFDPETPGVTPPANPDRHGAFLTDVVVELGFADQEAVEKAAKASRLSAQTIERALLESGVLDEEQLSRAIAERTGLDHVDLDRFDVDMEAAAMIGRTTAMRYRAVPIAFAADGALIVAVADPCESLGISDIESIARSEVRPVIASASDIQSAIERLPAEGAAPVPPPPPAVEAVEAPEAEEIEAPEVEEETEEERPEPPPAPRSEPPPAPTPQLPPIPKLAPPPMPRPPEPVRTEAGDRSTDLEALREAVRKADSLADAVGRRIGELEEAGERAQRLESELAAAHERIAALERRHSRLVAAAGEATAAIEKLGALSRALEETDS